GTSMKYVTQLFATTALCFFATQGWSIEAEARSPRCEDPGLSAFMWNQHACGTHKRGFTSSSGRQGRDLGAPSAPAAGVRGEPSGHAGSPSGPSGPSGPS